MNQMAQKSGTSYNMRSAVINYYLVAMFTVFPVFLTEQFVRARRDKYLLFCILSIALVAVVAIISVSYIQEKKNDPQKVFTENNIFKLSVTDCGMLAFYAVSVLSTLFCYSIPTAVNGSQGRNNGLILLSVYLAVYLVITRFYYHKQFVFIFLSIGMGAVCLLGLLNFFYIDPFGLFDNYDEQTVLEFVSTIGNRNLFSSFVCIYLPIVTALFVTTESKSKYRYFYLLGCAVGFCALMIGNSSSGYLGFFVSAAIMFLFFVKSYNYLTRYLISLIVMFLSAKVLSFVMLFAPYNKGLDDISAFFVNNNLSYVIVGGLALLFVLTVASKKQFENPKAVKVLFVTVSAVLIAGGVSLVSAFVYFTYIDKTTDIDWLASYFRFNDSWGTHRGFMWNKSFEIVKNNGVKDLLIGSGPDTFFYKFSPYFQELSDRFGNTSTDCAHNEYINYLVTHGILGLASYLVFTVSSIVNAVKIKKENPFVLVLLFAIICYMIQAVVNIAQPITTPLFIICISICESFYRVQRFKQD